MHAHKDNVTSVEVHSGSQVGSLHEDPSKTNVLVSGGCDGHRWNSPVGRAIVDVHQYSYVTPINELVGNSRYLVDVCHTADMCNPYQKSRFTCPDTEVRHQVVDVEVPAN